MAVEPMSVISLEEITRVAIAKTARLDPAQITLDLRLDELGLDSLRLTAVLSRIEIASGIELGSQQIVELLKCERIRDLVGSLEVLVA